MKSCCEWRDCTWEPEWEVHNLTGKKLTCTYHLPSIVEPMVRNVLIPYITAVPVKASGIRLVPSLTTLAAILAA